MKSAREFYRNSYTKKKSDSGLATLSCSGKTWWCGLATV